MASYHFAMQIIGRAKGRSAIAAAAYRSGQKLTDPKSGAIHDYSRRRGVVHAEIMLPTAAAPWLNNRQALWAHVEEMEKRKDAQLAREINLALPAELDAEDRLALVRDFIRSQFISRGMVADFAIHEPVADRGDDMRNHHAHIMLSLRQATQKGLHHVKTREWNSDLMLEGWREGWAAHQNRWLEYRGWGIRVDHRSLEGQRVAAQARGDRARAETFDRAPEIHVGPRARATVGQGRTPISQEREVRSRISRPRTRHYPQHDNGSRVQHLLRRLEGNLDAFDQKIARWQKRLMQAKQTRRYVSKAEFEAMRTHERLAKERVWLKKQEQQAAIKEAFRTAQRSRKRQAQADWLIDGIENVLRGMVGIRDKQIKRRYAIRDRRWGFEPSRLPARTQAHGRRRVWPPR